MSVGGAPGEWFRRSALASALLLAMASSEGYAYWHDKVANGEEAAPPPEHIPIAAVAATSATSSPEDTAITLSKFAFMDDDEVVKVYVTLEGDLAGVDASAVEFHVEAAKFDPTCSMLLHIRGHNHLYRLYVSHLMHQVVPGECKFKITAKGKLIVTLKKLEKVYWEGLRAKTCLPYRRGGGG